MAPQLSPHCSESTAGVNLRRRATNARERPTDEANARWAGPRNDENPPNPQEGVSPPPCPVPVTEELLEPKVSYSSGVAFYPPSDKYWRIGGKWYDFASFLPRHPGGAAVLELARDRFEDATFIFESHHLNYKRARRIIEKYEVPEEVVRREGLRQRPVRITSEDRNFVGDRELVGHHDRHLDSQETPKLLNDDSFYSVMRQRVYQHLKAVGYLGGGPTLQCKALFWFSFILWVACFFWLFSTATPFAAVCTGFSAAWLGAFGHNWVHQPKYKFWAYLSLDTIGFSSDMWFRDHNLQHHMYTNTPWDNHFEGTAPFLVTDPTIERNFAQRCMAYLNPIILSFGLYGNYVTHTVELLKGNERLSPWKLLLPLEIWAMGYRWGLPGLALIYLSHAILGIYYFTIALMNHNSERCLDVERRNASRDWGEAQLHVSADWAVGMPFSLAWVYLWLNYHTVHHLFPLVDFSHHPAIQQILIQTCKEFDIYYEVGNPVDIYKQMVRSFGSPTSLMQEINVYGGGL